MGSKWKTIRPLAFDGDLTDRKFPSVAGCYVVYADGKAIYVGQSTNLEKRIISYGFNYARYGNAIQTPWGTCEDLYIKIRPTRRYGDWAMIELRLIKRLQPKFNCVGSIKNRGQIFDRWKQINEQ